MEIVGFKVDQVFVLKWLNKNEKKKVMVDEDVMEFLKNQANFLKNKAVAQYCASKNPLEKLEYKLNGMIGPKKLKQRMEKAHGIAMPTDEALDLIIEPNIFTSSIIDQVCLFPKPLTKFERILHQNGARPGPQRKAQTTVNTVASSVATSKRNSVV